LKTARWSAPPQPSKASDRTWWQPVLLFSRRMAKARAEVQETQMTITGRQVKAPRQLLKATQDALAAEVRISPSTIGAFELGKRRPSDLQVAVAHLLGQAPWGQIRLRTARGPTGYLEPSHFEHVQKWRHRSPGQSRSRVARVDARKARGRNWGQCDDHQAIRVR
jgi:DNA-binding XRE family transcriptional regulator